MSKQAGRHVRTGDPVRTSIERHGVLSGAAGCCQLVVACRGLSWRQHASTPEHTSLLYTSLHYSTPAGCDRL